MGRSEDLNEIHSRSRVPIPGNREKFKGCELIRPEEKVHAARKNTKLLIQIYPSI